MPNPRPILFKKTGSAANPNGRPKREWTVAGLIEQAMEEQDETGVPYKKAVYNKLVSLAKKGDVMAIKEINNRLDGMPKQVNELTGKDGTELSGLINVNIQRE